MEERLAVQHEERPTWIVLIDTLSVATFAFAWSLVALRLFSARPLAESVGCFLLALPIALALSDLLSGAVHWFADRYFDPETPVFGPLLIEPFRSHHDDPMGIVRHGFLERCGNNAAVTLPFAALALWLGPPEGQAGLASFPQVLLLTTVLLVFLTNQFHAWAHAMQVPPGVEWLQRVGIILRREAHSLHHSDAHDQNYCVTTGWLNPVLNRVAFFPRIEAALARIGLSRNETRTMTD